MAAVERGCAGSQLASRSILFRTEDQARHHSETIGNALPTPRCLAALFHFYIVARRSASVDFPFRAGVRSPKGAHGDAVGRPLGSNFAGEGGEEESLS